ncbi:Hypp8943 [Branchiostoma lanceolatum]|uniref:Hypp8943 protein n=1 Tax=Branchiostoma lanceolatum TaxID=7740 RepID=A0A8K0EH88_BRALA|nr:Hypp8943 [Branchiostoma lanceolatum]
MITSWKRKAKRNSCNKVGELAPQAVQLFVRELKPQLQFLSKKEQQIKNPYPSYKGTLIQKYKRNGDPRIKVFRTANLGSWNEDDAAVTVYSFKSTPPGNGTYVVLQFEASEMYFASKEDRPGILVLEEPGEFDPENAEDITTTADRRVFLMKPHGTDVVFASCVASQQKPGDKSKAQVITVRRNKNSAAVFRLEGKGPALASQWFQLEEVSAEGDSEQS